MTTENKILLTPGTLWESVKKTTEQALKCGALQSIPTSFEFVEQDGVNFLVRILANIDRKKAAKKEQKQKTAETGIEFNPFLPYEQDLFVADISESHVCILNKFNVVDYHLLIITRAFEEQENLLTLADFAAMWACLADFDGLVFYNGGKVAGASQRHKHLQIVPLPLAPNGVDVPIASLFKDAKDDKIPGLPFLHAFTTLNPQEGADITLAKYQSLLQKVGIEAVEDNKQSGGYNLLITRQWMLIVPRLLEEYEQISINSLGFAGCLLVRNAEQMQLLKEISPMEVLKKVAFFIEKV
ncbi:MAG TPA: phosphorylase [Nostocaceae cyanobacterium]|nr:phosphorylase [Nostocaceae cyanobacterium]